MHNLGQVFLVGFLAVLLGVGIRLTLGIPLLLLVLVGVVGVES